ncbi:MAG: carbon storage regulator [Planctomycetaceae bacterium]
MLVLTRRKGEAICIGGNIALQVNDVKAGRVRLGVRALDHVSVESAAVFARKRQQSTRKLNETRSGMVLCTD